MITLNNMLENGIPDTIPLSTELNFLLIDLNDIPTQKITEEIKKCLQSEILTLINDYDSSKEIIYYKKVTLFLVLAYRYLLNQTCSDLVNLTGIHMLEEFQRNGYFQKIKNNTNARRLGAQNANKKRSTEKNRCFDIFKSLTIEQQKSRDILKILFNNYEKEYKIKLTKENYLVKRWVSEWHKKLNLR